MYEYAIISGGLMNLSQRSFLKLLDYTKEEIEYLLDLSADFKNKKKNNIPHEYLITIMRRMMYRISAKIAYSANAKILVNGESIGQVASQTLNSMSVINEVVKMPVIRPLACFDKLEIIEVAKKIRAKHHLEVEENTHLVPNVKRKGTNDKKQRQ